MTNIAKYNTKPYILIKDGIILQAGTKEEIQKSKDLTYYSDCEMTTREYDLYQNDNSLTKEFIDSLA